MEAAICTSSERQTPPLEDLGTCLSADIRQPMQQQVLSHERHPQISRQRQHMHGQPWKLLGKASAFSRKCQPGAAKKITGSALWSSMLLNQNDTVNAVMRHCSSILLPLFTQGNMDVPGCLLQYGRYDYQQIIGYALLQGSCLLLCIAMQLHRV